MQKNMCNSLKKIHRYNVLFLYRKKRLQQKFKTIEVQTEESEKNLRDAEELTLNASELLKDAVTAYNKLELIPLDLEEANRDFNGTLEENEKEIVTINNLRPQVQEHAANLSQRAQELDNLLTETRDTSTDAVTAANAYKNIVEAIEAAQKAANDGLAAAENAADLLDGVENKTQVADDSSVELLETAHSSQTNEHEMTPLLEENKQKYLPLYEKHLKNKELLDNIQKLLKQQQQPLNNELLEAKETAGHAEAYAVNTNSSLDQFQDVSNDIFNYTYYSFIFINFFLRYCTLRNFFSLAFDD